MRSLPRMLSLAASLALVLGLLAVPLRTAHAQSPQSPGGGVCFMVDSAFDAAVFVNGVPASPGDTFSGQDVVEVDAAADGYTSFTRSSNGQTYSWTVYGSIAPATFQAIWIGDD